MKNHIIGDMPPTGEVPLNLPSVIAQWNNRCCISQHNSYYRLYEDNWRAGKRMGATKITISENDAKHLIYQLGLFQEKSDTFRNASMWRTLSNEKRYVKTEIEAYFNANPNKKPSKFVQNIIDTMNQQTW